MNCFSTFKKINSNEFPPEHDLIGKQVLKVHQVCNDEDVKKAYLALAKQWHPDINKAPDAVDQFKRISEAYDMLKDEVRRSHYRAELQSRALNAKFSNPTSPFDSYNQNYQQQPKDKSFFDRFRAAYGSSHSSTGGGFKRVLSTMFLFGGPLLGVGTIMWLITNQNKKPLEFQRKNLKEDGDFVEAWFNPKSNRWETPAPWREEYKQAIAKAPNQQVRRHLVFESRR